MINGAVAAKLQPIVAARPDLVFAEIDGEPALALYNRYLGVYAEGLP